MRAVIDIGSNSVRLMTEGAKDKLIRSTQLSEGLSLTGRLNIDAMTRTAEAVREFYGRAIDKGAVKVYVFATEAVRSAANGGEFLDLMKECGISVDILSPEREAEAGFVGASLGGRAAVIDIGGASTEIIIGCGRCIVFSQSLALGVVKLRDLFGQDSLKIKDYTDNAVRGIGTLPPIDYAVAIGGTASTVAAILSGGYDRDRIHRYHLKYDEIEDVLDRIETSRDLSAIKGLPQMRRTIIKGGILLLLSIMEYMKLTEVIVSEEDNMEGYLRLLDN